MATTTSNVISRLALEHQCFDELSRWVSEATRALRDDLTSSGWRMHLATTWEIFESELLPHLDFEDDVLLPRAESSGWISPALATDLRADNDRIRALARRIPPVRTFAPGGHELMRLVQTFELFESAIRRHVFKGDEILLPRICQHAANARPAIEAPSENGWLEVPVRSSAVSSSTRCTMNVGAVHIEPRCDGSTLLVGVRGEALLAHGTVREPFVAGDVVEIPPGTAYTVRAGTPLEFVRIVLRRPSVELDLTGVIGTGFGSPPRRGQS